VGYKFVFYKFTIELNYSRDQNKYRDYDSDDKYSVYVRDGPDKDEEPPPHNEEESEGPVGVGTHVGTI
jgi:hypothetical protein